MRASRLLTLLLLLQAHGRLSARRLADELEVSIRTLYRDIEELSSAGVPVRAARGAAGGFELLEGWRTRLTGLTPDEAQAMFMAPAPAAQLGLGAAATSAQLKMIAALPKEWQADAQRVASRFHLDPVGWYRREEHLEHLPAVAEAVWKSLRLRVRYESWKADVERRIEPLGLVTKAGQWYLVATVPGKREARTYKVANIRALEVMRETFKRPRTFDLARYWAQSIERFEAGLYRATATVRASPHGLKALAQLSAAVADSVARGGKRDRHGWTQLAIPIESIEHAASELLKVGAECEVLAPRELRAMIATRAKAVAVLYA